MQSNVLSVSTSEVSAGFRPRSNLAETLSGPVDGGFRSFAVLPSNVAAVEAAMLFAGEIRPFVAIVGPGGWGKTHLLEAAAARLRSERGCSRLTVVQAAEWATGTRNATPNLPLILDNAQDALDRTRTRLRFRLSLERRVRAGHPTLVAFTSARITRAQRAALPLFRSWLVAEIAPPSAAEREVVVSQVAARESLALSEPLRKVLARIDGNGRSLAGALNRLRLESACWIDSRATVLALGLLNPFFAAHPTWDLREHILAVARSFSSADRGGISSESLAVYGMLKLAALPEADVARYMDMEPAKAYIIASKLEDRLAQSSADPNLLPRFLDRLVEALQAN